MFYASTITADGVLQLPRITRNWQGVPLERHEIVVNLIGSTRTEAGLEVHAWLDAAENEKSKKITDAEWFDAAIPHDTFHGEWDDKILPQPNSSLGHLFMSAP